MVTVEGRIEMIGNVGTQMPTIEAQYSHNENAAGTCDWDGVYSQLWRPQPRRMTRGTQEPLCCTLP